MAVDHSQKTERTNLTLVDADLSVLDQHRDAMVALLAQKLSGEGVVDADSMSLMFLLQSEIEQCVVMNKEFLNFVMNDQFSADINDILENLKKSILFQNEDFVSQMTADASLLIVNYIFGACRTAKMCLENVPAVPHDHVYRESISIRRMLKAKLLDSTLFDDGNKDLN